MGGQMDTWTKRYMGEWVGGGMNGWMDKWTDRQANGWVIDRQMDV
jgi:hypothetical protein